MVELIMDDADKQGHRWVKGQSGNPSGRPKSELSLTSILKKRFHDPKLVKAIVDAWIDMVTKQKNFQALAEMLNRLEGKVKETHELEAKLPVTLVFQPVMGQVIEGQGQAVMLTEGSQAEVIEGECKEIREG